MNDRSFQQKNECYCAHAGEEITLRSKFVQASDIMPDQPPRLSNRDCSHELDCNLQDKDACTYAVDSPRKRSN